MIRIAIIESDEDSLLQLELLLGESFELRKYRDGRSAVAALPDEIPDIVLLALELPGIPAIEVVEHLRNLPVFAGIPIVAMSSNGESIEALRELGFDDCIATPIPDDLELDVLIAKLVA